MATHPSLLSRSLIGWSSGRIAPSCPIDSAAKQSWKRRLTKIVSKCSENFKKAIKLGKMHLIKFVSNYSGANSRWVFGQFLENVKINRKPQGNNFGLISWGNDFSEYYRQILGASSEYFRFCCVINYLITGLLFPYREILSPRFYASSVRTSKTSGLLFHGRALASG